MELNVARGRHVRDVVTDRLPSCDRVHDVGDTSGDVLITPNAALLRSVAESVTRWRSSEASRGANKIARPAPMTLPVNSPTSQSEFTFSPDGPEP